MPRSLRRWTLLFAAASLYAQSSATTGRDLYQVHCANCHMADLHGRNEAPPLAGANFLNDWGGRTADTLRRYMQSTMPPANRGGLGEEAYANLAAFLLAANGAREGVSPTARIGDVASGEMPEAIKKDLAEAATKDQARP